jgi:type IX secretion system PorP/SprF family membrane protein
MNHLKQQPCRVCLLLCLIVATASATWGQDRHFTQFYAAPQTLNPALVGTFDGRYRVGVVSRDQWATVLDESFKTFAFNADLRLEMDPRSNFARDKVGVGLSFYNDKIGGLDFSNTQIAVAGAYHKSLNYTSTQYLSLGFQMGLNQRNLNYERFTFQDQFAIDNTGTFGYSNPSREVLPENNFGYLDMSAGINYSSAPKGQTAFFAGLAYHHFAQPNVSFYTRSTIIPSPLYAKASTQLALVVPVSRSFSISPRILASVQGPFQEANVGTNFRFLLDGSNGTALQLGTWVRGVKNVGDFNVESIVGLVGVEFNSLLFGFSYDLNLPAVRRYNQSQNAFEFSLIYLGEYDNDELLCPTF